VRIGAPSILASALVLGCAGAPPPLPAGASATPALGDGLALVLAKLPHAEGTPAAVELRELRVIDVAHEPWQSLEPAAAEGRTGPLGVIAGRRCTWRDGLSRGEAVRASWYLLRAGRLEAFDHQGFGDACAPRPSFEPAAAEDLALERSLTRYLAQRYPFNVIAADERFSRGLALLSRGRPDDARFELSALDRRLDDLERRQNEYETPDADERAALRREEERLRPLRARLHRELAEYTGPEKETP
jgi:hypothetical protein